MKKNAQLVLKQNYFNPAVWEQMKTMAETFIQSRALPKGIQNAAQAIMVMQAGYEMGMKPLQAMQGLTIINGVITVFGKETIRRLREHGWDIEYQEKDNECTATVTKGDKKITDTLTFFQAQKSKWTNQYRKDATGAYKKDENGNLIIDLKAGWYEGANRINKLRYGVISKILKTYIPEVLGSASDIAEVAEDYVIEETPIEATTHDDVPNKIVAPEGQRPSLDKFIEQNKNKPTTAGVKVENKDAQKRLATTDTQKNVNREADIKAKTEKLTEEVKGGKQ